MGRSTDTLQLLTSEQKAFKDNLHKSGVGYNGPYVLSQAYAKIRKLYRVYELCDKNKQLHVFDSEETLEDAEKSQLKMNEIYFNMDIKDMKDEFEHNYDGSILMKLSFIYDLLMNDQLLDASLTEDFYEFVITYCGGHKYKDLDDEIERISRGQKDVSNGV
ncbi:hypothetical protein Tco_0553630 [Tanacetum coccineum]